MPSNRTLLKTSLRPAWFTALAVAVALLTSSGVYASQDGHPAPAPAATDITHDHQHDHGHGDENTDAAGGFSTDRLLGWLGGLHPTVVHFPIALLIAGLLAEVIGSRAGRFCVVLAAISAVVAAGLGWLNGGLHWVDDDWVTTTHRWVGTGTAVWSIAVAWLCLASYREGGRGLRRWYLMSLGIGASLVAAAGFFGGALIYGIDHLAW